MAQKEKYAHSELKESTKAFGRMNEICHTGSVV